MPATLAHDLSGSDITGSKWRRARSASKNFWYGGLKNKVLTISREDHYEMALWVPYLEKGYALFAQMHGTYGVGAASQKSGYNIIGEGGYENQVYQIFYGADVIQKGITPPIQYAPGGGNVALNRNKIEFLLKMKKQRADPSHPEHLHLTASIGPNSAIKRLSLQIDHLLGQRNINQYRSFKFKLKRLKKEVDTWKNLAAIDPKKEKIKESIIKQSSYWAKPGSWLILHSKRNQNQYHDLLEIFNVVMHLGKDTSLNQRNIYANHAYAILDVKLQDHIGAALNFPLNDLVANLPNIDGGKSIVVLQNPHHRNEPDPSAKHAQGAADGKNDGVFEMSLDQIFRNFDSFDFARVKK